MTLAILTAVGVLGFATSATARSHSHVLASKVLKPPRGGTIRARDGAALLYRVAC